MLEETIRQTKIPPPQTHMESFPISKIRDGDCSDGKLVRKSKAEYKFTFWIENIQGKSGRAGGW